MSRLFELLAGVYWDARHWIWDRQERRFVREAYRRLGEDNCVYLHESPPIRPGAVLVRLAYRDSGDDNVLWEPHSHLEG